MKDPQGGLTLVLIPEHGETSRTLRLSGKRLRRLKVLSALGLAVAFLIMGSWGFFFFHAYRGWRLQALVDSLQAEREQIALLVRELDRVEAEYEHIRSLFGQSDESVAPDLWLPPSGLPGGLPGARMAAGENNLPSSWPLTQAGFITQSLIERGADSHPGLDIAVPTDSYVRAAGAGRVLRAGEDPLYGRFVVLDHGEGYQTIYAHASAILVERGQTVRRDEVIALSGSTGQSTAPHLHFEILLEGEPIDPLSMVSQPG